MTQLSEQFVQEQNFESLQGSGAIVDRGAGVVRGVKVIGFESKNGRSYPPGVLRQAVSQYEGAKVFFDHQEDGSKSGRKYKERFGTLKNARFVENKGVFADHHFNPEHPTSKQYAWDAENAPDSMGFSHTAMLKFAPKSDAQGRKVVSEIGKVLSVDLVAEPATTNGLFESKGQNMDFNLPTVEQLQEELAEANAKLRKLERDRTIREEIVAAGLDLDNKVIVSDVFLRVLSEAEDAETRKAWLADRAAVLVGATGEETLTGEEAAMQCRLQAMNPKRPQKPVSYAVEDKGPYSYLTNRFSDPKSFGDLLY